MLLTCYLHSVKTLCSELSNRHVGTHSYCTKSCYDCQVMVLVDIFRAKVVDISENTLTIEVKTPDSNRFTYI